MFASPFASPFPKSPISNYSPLRIAPQEQPQPDQNRYINFNAGNDGCMVYRRGFVGNHIVLSGLGDVVNLTKMVTEKGFYQNVKCITLQRQAAPHQKQFMEYLKSIQPEFGFKLIYEVDDVVFREEIPDHNASKHGFDSDEIRQNCVDMINMVDEVTVTCQYMKDLYIEKTGQEKITVVPNFMPHWWIGHQYDYRKICDNFEKFKKRPRIVYAGSGAHFDVRGNAGGQDDFTHVLKFIIDNRHKYQFVFIGAYPPPLHPYVQSKEIEFHGWKNLMEFPNFLASLNAQLFIAPLMDIPFNRAKSDIKFIEASQLGVPCLVQNMVTYSSAPEFLRFNTAEELAEKVEMLTNWKNRSKYYKLVPELRKLGETRFLELPQNIGCFLEAFDLDYGDSRRKYLKKWNP
jgi:glycosyltransferase involved in cell wall biosynthesis